MFLISHGQIISIISISSYYTTATSEVVSAGFIASAHLAIEVANVYSVMALDLPSVGVIIIGLVMLKGAFSKRTAYLVILAGALAVMSTFEVLVKPLKFGTLFGLILIGV